MTKNKRPKQKLPQDRWKRLSRIAQTILPICLALNELLDLVAGVRDLL